MPNHVQNRLCFSGTKEAVSVILADIKGQYKDGDVMQIDFNKIKPMPESLNITSGTCYAWSLLFGKGDTFLGTSENQRRFSAMSVEEQKKDVELAFQYDSNVKSYGHTTWYDWSIEQWGTKWNAYQQNDSRNTEDTIYFQTAWSSPIELMQELSRQHPEVLLDLKYADEDSGSNTGHISFQAGEAVFCSQPESQSKEGYEIYFELNPEDRNLYEFVDGKYQYIDE